MREFKVKELQFLDGGSKALPLRGLKGKGHRVSSPRLGDNEIPVWDEGVVGCVGPEMQHVLLEEV